MHHRDEIPTTAEILKQLGGRSVDDALQKSVVMTTLNRLLS